MSLHCDAFFFPLATSSRWPIGEKSWEGCLQMKKTLHTHQPKKWLVVFCSLKNLFCMFQSLDILVNSVAIFSMPKLRDKAPLIIWSALVAQDVNFFNYSMWFNVLLIGWMELDVDLKNLNRSSRKVLIFPCSYAWQPLLTMRDFVHYTVNFICLSFETKSFCFCDNFTFTKFL